MARRVDKPIRLYVLAVLVVIGYGLLPLVSVFPFTGGFFLVGPRILPFNGSIQFLYGPDGEAPFLLIFISLFLGIFSAASAIFAATGVREGRTATLIFVTLNFGWWNLLAALAILNSDKPGETAFQSIDYFVFPPIWFAIIWWNYFRPDIGAYYHQQDRLEQ